MYEYRTTETNTPSLNYVLNLSSAEGWDLIRLSEKTSAGEWGEPVVTGYLCVFKREKKQEPQECQDCKNRMTFLQKLKVLFF